MAKKTRTPPPPRRVQAPQRRAGSSGGGSDDARRRKRLLLFGAVAAIVVGGILLGYFLARGSGNGNAAGSLAATMRKGGCTLKTYPSVGRTHLQSLTAKPKYNSFPPTSGPHYFQPAIFNQYSEPVVEIQAVHNLEHGAIVIQYGSGVSKSAVDQITAFYQDDPNALLVAPLPKLGDKIALTAWTHLATCSRFDEKAFKAFRDAYRYHAPEHFPPSALNPGQ